MSRSNFIVTRSRVWMLALTGVATMSTAHAEESLLWKAVNTTAPVVVPAYAGQGSPFPKTELPASATSDTSVEDEQARLREEAYNAAEKLVKSGNALVPDFRTIQVGGVVEGNLGARVLINNQWIGVGGKILARQYKTQAVIDAIKALTELDSVAGQEINDAVNKELSANPTITLTLQKITSSSLVLGGPKGKTNLSIRLNP